MKELPLTEKWPHTAIKASLRVPEKLNVSGSFSSRAEGGFPTPRSFLWSPLTFLQNILTYSWNVDVSHWDPIKSSYKMRTSRESSSKKRICSWFAGFICFMSNLLLICFLQDHCSLKSVEVTAHLSLYLCLGVFGTTAKNPHALSPQDLLYFKQILLGWSPFAWKFLFLLPFVLVFHCSSKPQVTLRPSPHQCHIFAWIMGTNTGFIGTIHPEIHWWVRIWNTQQCLST